MLELREGLSQSIMKKKSYGQKKKEEKTSENSCVNIGHNVCQQISRSSLKKYLQSIQHGES